VVRVAVSQQEAFLSVGTTRAPAGAVGVQAGRTSMRSRVGAALVTRAFLGAARPGVKSQRRA